jgi:hypothetical protein
MLMLPTQVHNSQSTSYSAAVKLSTASGNSHPTTVASANKPVSGAETELKRSDWASQTSTPYVRRNCNPSYYDTDVDWNMDSHTETTADDQPFTVVNSRKKRKRTRTNQEHSNKSRAGPQTGQQTSATPHAPLTSHVERRRGPLIIGKLSATGVNSAPSIVAARPLVQKAVFCIDNVDQSVSVHLKKFYCSWLTANAYLACGPAAG